jgi:flagellar hook protein FlgE
MSFNIALSGLNAASTDLNVISNNIANANTTGFKDSRAEFGDLIQGSVYSAAGVSYGNGVTTQTVAQQFSQGTITTTNNPLDLALNGDGFFTLSEGGTLTYSRNGEFSTDKDGYVVNEKGLQLQVYPAVKGPNGTTNFSLGTLKSLQISSTPNPPAATKNVVAGLTLPVAAPVPSISPFDPNDPNTYNVTTAATIYDSLGQPHTAGLFFTQDATTAGGSTPSPGNWHVHLVVDGQELNGPAGDALTFDSSGNLTSGPLITYTAAAGTNFVPTDGAAPMDLTLNVANTIQYGSNFQVNSLSQDGYTTGQLSGVQISQAGVVTATYTNGQNVALGQVALAKFPNSQGLQQLGNATWAPTFDSGQATPGTAGSSNFGTLQSGALESSNTDLTEQLVSMMTAQRNYQANSQVISTEDQLLQTILQLR